MIIEALSNKGRSEICLLSAFTMGSTIVIRCLGIDAAPLLPIITAALNRLQPPLKHAALFFFFPPPLFFFVAPPSASQTLCQQIKQEICVLVASSVFCFFCSSFQGSPPPEPCTALQTFRPWSEEEEEEDHGPVHAPLLPPLSVF